MDLANDAKLKLVLLSIRKMDELKNYDKRNHFIYGAVYLALVCGLSAGFRIDPKEPDWPCAFIELPTGQVSWHMPQHPIAWDDHTTEQKYERINGYIGDPKA